MLYRRFKVLWNTDKCSAIFIITIRCLCLLAKMWVHVLSHTFVNSDIFGRKVEVVLVILKKVIQNSLFDASPEIQCVVRES